MRASGYTVIAAASAADARNDGDVAIASGTSPFAEKVLISPAARTSVSNEPASVVTVAQASDLPYDAVPDP